MQIKEKLEIDMLLEARADGGKEKDHIIENRGT